MSSAPSHTRFDQPYRPTLLALAIAACLSGALHPASVMAAEGTGTAQTQPAKIQFDIAPGTMAAVLNRFASEAGITLSFDSNDVAGLRSQGVKGSYPVEEALGKVLAGTTLQVSRTASGAYTVSEPSKLTILPAVEVGADIARTEGTPAAAYRVSDARVGVLGNKTLQDTPYSVEVFSREYMDNTQARSLADVTRYDASISPMVDNNFAESWVGIRGLEIDLYSGKKIDGMNFSMFLTELPLEHMERVEVLKGAGGFLYGFGAPGGTINYILKRPTQEFSSSLSTQVVDSGLLLLHGDIGGRAGQGDQFGYRVSLVHEGGDTYIDQGESKRTSGSIALDWHITSDIIWQIDAMQGEHTRDVTYPWVTPNSTGTAAGGFASNGKPPKPVDGSKRIAPDFGRTYTDFTTIGTNLNWQFTRNWSAAIAYRKTEEGREFMNGGIVLSSPEGDYEIFAQNFSGALTSEHAQGIVSGRVETGLVVHDVTLGYSQYESHNGVSWLGGRYETAFLGPGNLSSPTNFSNPFSHYVTIDEASGKVDITTRKELFASDTLQFGSDWDLIIGLRDSEIEIEDAEYDKSDLTPTLAMVYRPMSGISLYGSYIEALEQGETAPLTADNPGEVFPPLVSKQYEVGAKTNSENWELNTALFQINKGLTYTTSDNVFTQDGIARYQGLEVSGKAIVGSNWLFGASAIWLEATNEKTTDQTLKGKNIQGSAEEQYRLYGEYSIVSSGWVITGGTQYIGERSVDTANQWYVDSITLLELGARYETAIKDSELALRLNVENLSDEAYWISRSGSGDLVQGAPRTFVVGAQLDF